MASSLAESRRIVTFARDSLGRDSLGRRPYSIMVEVSEGYSTEDAAAGFALGDAVADIYRQLDARGRATLLSSLSHIVRWNLIHDDTIKDVSTLRHQGTYLTTAGHTLLQRNAAEV